MCLSTSRFVTGFLVKGLASSVDHQRIRSGVQIRKKIEIRCWSIGHQPNSEHSIIYIVSIQENLSQCDE